jgi:Fe2+ transport system protein FeoA
MIRPAKSKTPSGEMPLDQMENGTRVRIVRIEAGHSLKNRLAAMGCLTDEPIEVIRNDHHGQVIIAVKNTRIVLGRGMSQKIFVQ